MGVTRGWPPRTSIGVDMTEEKPEAIGAVAGRFSRETRGFDFEGKTSRVAEREVKERPRRRGEEFTFGSHPGDSGSINDERVIEFLRVLLRHLKGPIVLIWDNIPTHRSRRGRQWLAEHPRFHVEPLPPYAPELNGDEGVWQYLKHSVVANYCPADWDELERQIQRGVRTMRQKPHLLRSFITRTGLPF